MFKKYLNLKLLKYLVWFYTLTMFLHMLKLVYIKYSGGLQNLDWCDLFAYTVFLKWAFVLLFMIFISAGIKWMVIKKIKPIYIISNHIFFAFFMYYFVFSMGSLYLYFFGHFDIEQALGNVSFAKFLSEVIELFLAYFALVGIIHGYYYVEKKRRIELENTKIGIQLSDSKMNMLKAHLHPQFIFNTLDSVSTLIDYDDEKAQNLIADFGDLFRDVIELKNKNFNTLRGELDILDKYIEIISVRLKDKLQFKINSSKEIEQLVVPNLILFPLVETMIDLNVDQYDKMLFSLSIYKEDKQLIVDIVNNGLNAKNTSKNIESKSVKLENINERLRSLYKIDFEFFITSNEYGYPHLKMKIPIINKSNL